MRISQEYKKISIGERFFLTFNYIFLGVCAVIAIFPFINVLAISLSSTRAIQSGEVVMWPVDINFVSYINLIEDGTILGALKNTVIITLVGTTLQIISTIIAAYALSKKRLKGREFIILMITFTMMFHPGLIPHFMLIKNLGLINSYWGLWIPSLIGVFNMFVMKTFFQGIPESLEEAAAIDGANDLYILFRIVLPLSIPVITTISLFYGVHWWNSYRNVLIYITDTRKFSLMLRLYQMINTNNHDILENPGEADILPEALKAAAIIIATTPILCVYPFLQKYFVKGVRIGALKG